MHPRASGKWTILPLLGLLLLCAPARAQDAPESPPKAADSAQKAKQLFVDGSTQYQLGKFEEALKLYEESFKLQKRVSIIFNIAQCYRQLQRPRKARFFYKLYLSEWDRVNPGKPSPYKKEIDGWIKELTAEIDRTKTKPRVEPKPVEPTTRRVALVPTEQPPPAKPRTTPFYKKWWFWTIVGVAVVGATATIVGVAAQPDDIPPPEGTLGFLDI